MKKQKFIDLHLHLDGSLSVASVRRLAAMQGMQLPDSDDILIRKMQAGPDCKNLTEYLERFAFALSFLQTEQAVEESVFTLLEECRERGMIYVEVRFAPQLHTEKGLSQRQVIEAAVRGLKRSELLSGLILCCMRGEGTKEKNIETVQLAAEYLEKGVCAVDLAGDEYHFAVEGFREEFALAKELGVPFTIHAGEADGPKSVWGALMLGAKRIGHGVRSVEDPLLIKELAANGVVLELCPTSNLDTSVFANIEEYPLRTFLEAGVKVTINSDNMTVSDTDAERELYIMEETACLSREEVDKIKRSAVEAAFADEDVKEKLRDLLKEESKDLQRQSAKK